MSGKEVPISPELEAALAAFEKDIQENPIQPQNPTGPAYEISVEDNFDPFAPTETPTERPDQRYKVVVFDDDAHTRKSYNTAFDRSDRFVGAVMDDPIDFRTLDYTDCVVVIDLAYRGEYCIGRRPKSGVEVMTGMQTTPLAILVKSSKTGMLRAMEQGEYSPEVIPFTKYTGCPVHVSGKEGISPGSELINDLERLVDGEMGEPVNKAALEQAGKPY